MLISEHLVERIIIHLHKVTHYGREESYHW